MSADAIENLRSNRAWRTATFPIGDTALAPLRRRNQGARAAAHPRDFASSDGLDSLVREMGKARDGSAVLYIQARLFPPPHDDEVVQAVIALLTKKVEVRMAASCVTITRQAFAFHRCLVLVAQS